MSDGTLIDLGYVTDAGELTEPGHRYYLAQHVRQDQEAASQALSDVLSRNAIANAFCATLWGTGDLPVAGAVSLLKRLTRDGDEHSAKRWLELLNRAELVAYNRKNPRMRVRHNPDELVPPAENDARERDMGHVVDPNTPFGNLLALRDLLRASRGYLYWYEQHMEPKVLEVLYRELPKGAVSTVRLLSGPSNANTDTKADFKRFTREMKDRRDIACEWRVLSKKASQLRHDRFLFSEGISRNLPPLNLILRGSTGEILPSAVKADQFIEWWNTGQDLNAFRPPEGPGRP